jgi:uncharacterized protein (TIGR03435 family)
LGCSTASGQGNSAPAERPAFDAASVKADPSLSLRHVLLPPAGGRLSTRMASLQLLIQNAYGVQSFQVSGGPDWMNSSGYDVEARAEGNPSRSQVWLMLQSLLEDRFKLKVHRETKVLPVFALTAAKSGLKLPPPKEGDCVDASAPAVPPVSGQRPLPPCGEAQVGFEPATGLFVAGGQVAMAELIRVLSGLLQRPIVDETGFLQKFDIDLRFAYEEGVTAVPNPWRQSDSGQGGDPAANPSIMTALQQQLGLKLVSTKGPVEVLVIDHVEKPSEN